MHKYLFSRKSLGIPYALFLLLFVMAPLLVLIYFAFTNGQGEFTMLNLTGFFSDPNTLGTLCYSFGVALVTTAVCLLLAYPVAYILATSRLRTKSVIIMLFIMPMWINFPSGSRHLRRFLHGLREALPIIRFLTRCLV